MDDNVAIQISNQTEPEDIPGFIRNDLAKKSSLLANKTMKKKGDTSFKDPVLKNYL